jgi:hypothetical protein
MLTDLLLGATPVAGGALLGLLAGNAGNSRAPDFRAAIKADQEILSKLPPEDSELRAALKNSIDARIRDLIAGTERSQRLRETAASNWRDIVLFVCAVLFTIVWWNVPHSRSNWLVMFVVLIALTVLAALYAGRGIARGLAERRHRPSVGAGPS